MDDCRTPLFGSPPDYIRACGNPAVGHWHGQRRCTKHLLEMKAEEVHWDSPDPAEGPLFWLCLPIVLVYVVGVSAAKVAWAWLKTKLPSRRVLRSRHCTLCGWSFWWEVGTPVVCGSSCEAKRQALSAIKLFCCDVDLEYEGTKRKSGYSPGASVTTTITKTYRCPSCGRVWLYGEIWYSDRAREADWHPQWTEAETAAGEPPPLYDERTRTKVYLQPSVL